MTRPLLNDALSIPPAAPSIGTVPGNQGGEGIASFSIELQPLGFAPFGELVRVKVYADHPDAAGFERLAALFCGQQPLLIGPMEFVAILKQGAQAGEIPGGVPDHPDDLSLHDLLPAPQPAPLYRTADPDTDARHSAKRALPE